MTGPRPGTLETRGGDAIICDRCLTPSHIVQDTVLKHVVLVDSSLVLWWFGDGTDGRGMLGLVSQNCNAWTLNFITEGVSQLETHRFTVD